MPVPRATSATPAAGDPRAPVAVFRAALIAVCALLSVLPPHHVKALVVLLLLAVGAWAAYRYRQVSPWWVYASAVLASGGVPWTGGARSPLLPYLLAPGLALGLGRDLPRLALVLGLSGATLLAGFAFPDASTGGDYAIAAGQWLLLSLALGLVAAWASRLSAQAYVVPDRFAQVRRLLHQLRSLTGQFPGGLDAQTTAEAVLDRCAAVTATSLSAVLVQPAGSGFVPLAVRGATRVPWRAPLDEDGPLREAWQSCKAVLDVRPPDEAGRRQGSALLALPLLADGRPYGLVVLEAAEAFPEEAVAELSEVVEESSSQLEAALLFEEVRLLASIEERDRLAREMHDGIAQDLAFLGYRLDELHGRATEPEVAQLAAEIRGELTGLISELRMSIVALRTSSNPTRGLGAALSAHLQAISATQDLSLSLSLHESSFRLPVHHEVALLAAAQCFTQAVRRADDVSSLTVRLNVDPPSATLEMSCDGSASPVELGQTGDTLEQMGATVTQYEGLTGGPGLRIELGGTDDQRASGRRPRAHPTGAAAGVRAD
jgi:signal transduction histidine kinase